MKPTENKPKNQSSRPSLYQTSNTTSFSILDAATVQGTLKRAKPTATAAPTGNSTPRRWPWGVGIGVLGATAGLALWYPKPEPTVSSVASPTTVAPTKAVAAAAAPITPPQVVPPKQMAKTEDRLPALVEQLEAPSEKSYTPTGADPLSLLEDRAEQTPAPTKPAAPTQKPAKAAAKPMQKAKPKPASKLASKAHETPPAVKPAAAKAHRDGDVDFMEAVLSRLPKPEVRADSKQDQ